MKQKSAKFEKEYFKGKGNNYFSSLEYKTGNLAYLYQHKIKPVLKKLIKKDDKVLDIGCALGILLSMLERDGYQSFGTDISHFAISEARKKTKAVLQISDVNQSFPYENNSFSAIFAIDIIEHLNSPFKFAQEVRRVLKKGGLFFIHTPNINSVFEKIYKKDWFGYKDKSHLYLFNRKSLQFLLQQAGFKIIVNETLFYPAPIFLRPFFFKTEIGGTVWIICQKL